MKYNKICQSVKIGFIFRSVCFCSFFFLLNACKEETEIIPTGAPIGPIPAAEFESVPIPTYDEVIAAYEAIVSNDSTVLQNEEILARALFDEIKRIKTGTGTALHPNNARTNFVFRLSLEEWKLVMTNPFDAISGVFTVNPAADAAEESFSCDPGISLRNTKADAVRHAYWNILLVKATNVEFAEEYTTAHETSSENEWEKAMDLHNNKVGRDLAIKYPDATELQLLELLLQERFTYIPVGSTIPANTEGLVYIEGKEIYDLSLTGSMTNPDSGGPWDASFSMHQCGETLRGHFVITRGEELQRRRFSGILNSDGSLTLNVTEPYQFENPRGLIACSNMVFSLTGNEIALNGNWTSSNCRQGGVVLLTP